MLIRNLLLSLGFWSSVLASPISTNGFASATEFPVIDLGYALHRASSYNESYDAYTFRNIRFAASPTGPLRFGLPQPPPEDRGVISDGSSGFDCPGVLEGFGAAKGPESEDCLFLDVVVPRTVLNGEHGNVPVLFWIFGGGYIAGSKDALGDPISFLKHSPSPVVYVATNYRLGVFGWLGGPSFTLSEGTVPNAGLYDQQFALQWVHDNIHYFHGDKDEVTAMGGSSGAGSVMHHITAYGGKGEAPLFKRAIPLGPGFYLSGGHASAEESFTLLEDVSGCSGKGVDCIRALSTDVLQKANREVASRAKAPRIGPGPTIDGDLVPDSPVYLLSQGRSHNVSILVADDLDEGIGFINGSSTQTTLEILEEIFPCASNATITEILTIHYPPPTNATAYTTELGRIAKIVSDTVFNCNRYSMSNAFPDSYNLLFSIPPGLHGAGVQVLFSDELQPGVVISPQIRDEIRRFIMNFVVTGNPNEANGVGGVSEGVKWLPYGSEGNGLGVSGTSIRIVDAAKDKSVCDWWAKGLVLG